MTINAKIIVLRKDIPTINKVVGDVIDIISINKFEGNEVIKVGENYSRIYVSDLDENIASDLKTGIKRLKKPDVGTPVYDTLSQFGYIEVDNSSLLNYLEVVNA